MSAVRRPAPRRGFTLIEGVIAIVVMGIGLAGVMLALDTATRGSADPVVNRQLQAIAQTMLEEIALKPYAAQANAAPSSACARDTFNDLLDYNGYGSGLTGICAVDGTPIPGLADYEMMVEVVNGSINGVTDAKRIVVNVWRGEFSLRVETWRTNYL